MSDPLDDIVSLCKRRGFIFQSSDIYGGLGATYDYGPLGVELKRNVKEAWWQAMVYEHDNVVGQDAAIMMHPKTWEASGHLDAFNDPMIDDRASGYRYRADELIEEHAAKLRRKDKPDEAERVEERLSEAFASDDPNAAFYEIIQDEEIRAPDSGAFDWTEVRNFNLMFETQGGPVEGDKLYLRPETAQGIFVNFRLVQRTARQQVPFGVAQIGKAFRNEIVARQFTFRTREFEQMEMQYFVKPGEQEAAYEKWKRKRMAWHRSLGIRPEKLRWHAHEQLSHYADAAEDVEYEFPMGWKEIEGLHSRTDFDLRRHDEFSNKKMQYYDPYEEEKYIPYVVETSAGLDRILLMLLCDAYREEEVDGDERTVLRFHPKIAPTTAAIFPLVKKEGMPEIAHEIEDDLRGHFNVRYDEKGSMGKRYRRQDEAGTPFCITVDGQTLDDDTVTVRDRDSMEQVRVPRDELAGDLMQRIADWER
jgi:glycyl-tRNA synthetase